MRLRSHETRSGFLPPSRKRIETKSHLPSRGVARMRTTHCRVLRPSGRDHRCLDDSTSAINGRRFSPRNLESSVSATKESEVAHTRRRGIYPSLRRYAVHLLDSRRGCCCCCCCCRVARVFTFPSFRLARARHSRSVIENASVGSPT